MFNLPHRSIRFSLVLPLLSLLLTSLLVGSVVPKMIRVNRSLPNRRVAIGDLPIDPAVINDMIRESKTDTHRSLPNALELSSFLNMPAMLIEIAISLPTTWPDSWYPSLPYPFGDLLFWRSISWPIYALPLWWLGGRAIDALRFGNLPFTPRINLVEAIIMGVIGTLSGSGGVGLFLTEESGSLHDGLTWVIVPGLLWLGLGILSVLAWFRQKRFATKIQEQS